MAIVLENGVTLPDIPADLLAQYPYCYISHTGGEMTIMGVAMVVDMYAAYATASPIVFFEGMLTNSDKNDEYAGCLMFSFSPGTPSTEWERADANFAEGDTIDTPAYMHNEASVDGGGGYSTAELMWANHDIYVATGIDDTGVCVFSDDILFLDSTATVEGEYKAPGTWYQGMADVVRKVTGVQKRYDVNEMLERGSKGFWMANHINKCKRMFYESAYEYTMRFEDKDCEDIDLWPFSFNYNMQSASFPNAKSVGFYAFGGCASLTSINIPLVKTIKSCAFEFCPITVLDLPSATEIEADAFVGCDLKLLALRVTDGICRIVPIEYTENGEVIDAATTLFSENSPILSGEGGIAVPAALVDAYKADEFWSVYADAIGPLESITMDGTVTGELPPIT